jgi:hypothetical protein
MKYKLIKEYPGSPKLGYIDDLNKSGHNNRGEYVQSMYDKNPEFWELVVEKDYEILSLVASEKNPQHKKGSKFLHNKDYKFKNMHPTEFWDIYSVKRISDNKIFTIGDFYEDLIIEKMFMSVAGDILTTYKPKIKKPLFTTEDGVDIFEGDTYYKVVNESFQLLIMERASKGESLRSKVFSTKEKAEEYILLNKPVLSLKDVASIYPGINKSHPDKPSSQSERLKNLVKSKIQQSV